jgi:hypothetical protein
LLEEKYLEILQENLLLKEEVCGLQTEVEHMQRQHGIETTKLKAEIEHLTDLNTKFKYGAKMIANDDRSTCFYTGIPSYEQFYGLFQLFEPLVSEDVSKSVFSLEDEFFMVLLKLRLGTPNEDVAYCLTMYLLVQ